MKRTIDLLLYEDIEFPLTIYARIYVTVRDVFVVIN